MGLNHLWWLYARLRVLVLRGNQLPYQGEIRLTRLEKIFRYTGFKT